MAVGEPGLLRAAATALLGPNASFVLTCPALETPPAGRLPPQPLSRCGSARWKVGPPPKVRPGRPHPPAFLLCRPNPRGAPRCSMKLPGALWCRGDPCSPRKGGQILTVPGSQWAARHRPQTRWAPVTRAAEFQDTPAWAPPPPPTGVHSSATTGLGQPPHNRPSAQPPAPRACVASERTFLRCGTVSGRRQASDPVTPHRPQHVTLHRIYHVTQ